MRCQKHKNNVADADCPICLKKELEDLKDEVRTIKGATDDEFIYSKCCQILGEMV